MKRPNILFLMSDEHRADVAGFAGDPVIRTPTLDRLAASGTVFANAYTPSPICIPARQCMMAGQLPRTCGCEVYGNDLPPGHMTFARLFSQYAYSTVACGKLHHMGTDMMQGWTQRIGMEMQMGAQYIAQRQEQAFRENRVPNRKWSDAKEVQRAGIGVSPYGAEDAYTVQGALHFIERYFVDPYYDRPQSEKPLLLKVSLCQPHYPYLADAERFTYYINRVRPYIDEPVSDHPFLSSRQVRPGVDASERDLRRATAAYYAMIETIDARFAMVLQALERVGQDLSEWIIIYTSDHGEMLGQHGIWEKQKFYEASVRVPLIISWPARFAPKQTVRENVNLCDLFATLCELAAIPVPPGLDSRSLAPLLAGHKDGWDNESISHFGRTNLMIKRDYLKYQYYGPDMPEVLFDLEDDPQEVINRIDDPAYALQVEQFRRRRGELGYGQDRKVDGKTHDIA